MSELTSFFIQESADFLWPASAIRSQNLAQNARVAADFIFTELSSLAAIPTATIDVSRTQPTVRQMETRLAERTARIQASVPANRAIETQIARAEQVTIRVNHLRIAHSLPTLSTETARIQTASKAVDTALDRGDRAEAEHLAREAVSQAAALERQVAEAIGVRIDAMNQAGDAIARVAGLFTAFSADISLSAWANANRGTEMAAITRLVRTAQDAYVAEDYDTAMKTAQATESATIALADAADAAVSRQQMTANVQAATQILTGQGFNFRTEDLPDGTIRVTAIDRGKDALDITFQADGHTVIDSHTHGMFTGAGCSVTVGKFLAAYRERVRLTDVNRSLLAGTPGAGRGASRLRSAAHRRLSASEIVAQTAPKSRNRGAGSPPQALVCAWSQLKH